MGKTAALLFGRHGNLWTTLLCILYFAPLYFGYLYFQTLVHKREVLLKKIGIVLPGAILFCVWTWLALWVIIEVPQHTPVTFK